MTTQSEESTTTSGFVTELLTRLIVNGAKILAAISLKVIYYVYMAMMIVFGVIGAVMMLAGGTALVAVLFGKVFAVLFFLVAFAVCFTLPIRETFVNVRDVVRSVFVHQASAA